MNEISESAPATAPPAGSAPPADSAPADSAPLAAAAHAAAAHAAGAPTIAQRLAHEVLAPLKTVFVGKDEVVDLLGVCLVAGEHLFILGPPGTAKSAIVQELSSRLSGQSFDYLLTRFTEPNELFGPFDIRRLREGELVTNTEGMLPEAEFVFLDDLLNANSAVLNSLLMVLNERVFRRGRETRSLPLLLVVSASNRLPDDEALGALFDRFLARVRCDNVASERLGEVLTAGWQLGRMNGARPLGPTMEEIRSLQRAVSEIDLEPVRAAYLETIHRLRQAGMSVSDRRAVRLQRLVAASALLCGRKQANRSDLWTLRYIWDTEEQREVIAAIVQAAVDKAEPAELAAGHPRAQADRQPNPEELAADLDRMLETAKRPDLSPAEKSTLQDQLNLLAGRCGWIVDPQARNFLHERVESLWQQLKISAVNTSTPGTATPDAAP